MARLEDTWRYVEHLDLLSQLIEDYLRELPQMIDHIPRRIQENTLDEERKRVYTNSSATDFKAEIVGAGDAPQAHARGDGAALQGSRVRTRRALPGTYTLNSAKGLSHTKTRPWS